MTKALVFIADEYANDLALLQSLGTEHKLGGAEQDDLAMLHYLEKKQPFQDKLRCSELTSIDPSVFYVVANFATLPTEAKTALAKVGNYVIYEHDHKYCRGRNPAVHKNMLVPAAELCDLEFYAKAKAVFCMTEYHKTVVDKNITANTIALKGSFWVKDELDLMEELNKTPKVCRAFVYGNESAHKGLEASLSLCRQRGMEYDIVPNQPTRAKFLEKLSGYDFMVFLPGSPETCSRLVVEAVMMNVRVITSNIVGATYEPWFQHIRGKDLIHKFKREIMPAAINKIWSQLC